MIELTEEQRQAVQGEEPPRLVDPQTSTTYVLIRAELYDRLRSLLDDTTLHTTAEMLDAVMAGNDANDPYLAELQRLELP